MVTEFNERLSNPTEDDHPQVWIIGTRHQVRHIMNELVQRRFVIDRIQFTPLIPLPFHKDKYPTVLVR